jgi:hypothetical protein
LAVTPRSAKILVADRGLAAKFLHLLVEKGMIRSRREVVNQLAGILDSEQIEPFDSQYTYFAKAVFR